MQRREFITFLGVAAVACPLGARAQQPKIPVVGFLNGGSPDGYAVYVTGFLHGLSGGVSQMQGALRVPGIPARALAVRARIVQSRALRLSTKPARFATRRSAIIVRPVADLTRSADIQVNERVLLRPFDSRISVQVS